MGGGEKENKKGEREGGVWVGTGAVRALKLSRGKRV